LKSLCFSVFYSIGDEFHQSFLPYRDCELGDVMADTSGVLAGFILLLLYKKYRGKETLLSRQLIES
jgi:VanZ family protein